MTRTQIFLRAATILTLCAAAHPSPAVWAQTGKAATPAVQAPAAAEQPDAQRTKSDLDSLLERYPPNLRNTLALDPALVGNQPYLAPYPALAAFFAAHPEIARNPSFYLGQGPNPRLNEDPTLQLWRNVLDGVAIFTGFAMGIGLLVWLIRTLIDYRRWSRLATVQTAVHTKLLDRFTSNDDLLAYIHSPAGARFLQSTPITLDAGPRSVGAPLGRILWSVQGGVVLLAAGIGLQVVSNRVADAASQPLHALGVLGIALGLGFLVSAIISYVISNRLGLLEPAAPAPRIELPGA